jgi:hypothetical protein
LVRLHLFAGRSGHRSWAPGSVPASGGWVAPVRLGAPAVDRTRRSRSSAYRCT